MPVGVVRADAATALVVMHRRGTMGYGRTVSEPEQDPAATMHRKQRACASVIEPRAPWCDAAAEARTCDVCDGGEEGEREGDQQVDIEESEVCQLWQVSRCLEESGHSVRATSSN